MALWAMEPTPKPLPPRERLDAAGATDVASTLKALATPSRL
jgi:hypothetical protein